MMTPITASAATTGYFNTYSTIASIPPVNGASTTQGFAVGSTYVYSVKNNNSTDATASIYRTRMDNGSTQLMTNGDDGTTVATYMGHGNDLVLSTINGVTHMFVVTIKTGSLSFVKLRYDSATAKYFKVGNYTLQVGGVNKPMAGAKILSQDASNINFLFEYERSFYRGSIPLTANSGVINLTYDFNIDVANALVNGQKVSAIMTSGYVHQGLGYYSGNDSIYVPITHANVSIVLVYRNVSSASGTITSDPNTSFKIVSSSYPTQFEVEGVGVGLGGKLYFNTNRDNNADGVHYFNGYTAY
ncbi:MAG: hypothetical protein H0X13_07920 [Ramlibacter sp.]|nr:hypothetical protein [Ramlibacter sp.]